MRIAVLVPVLLPILLPALSQLAHLYVSVLEPPHPYAVRTRGRSPLRQEGIHPGAVIRRAGNHCL